MIKLYVANRDTNDRLILIAHTDIVYDIISNQGWNRSLEYDMASYTNSKTIGEYVTKLGFREFEVKEIEI